MARRRIPMRRWVSSATFVALPGLVVIAILFAFDALGPVAAAAGAAAVLVLALAVAVPFVGDLSSLSSYGEALARDATAPVPDLSGWRFATELAARLRRIAREAHAREEDLRESAATAETVFNELPQPLVLVNDARKVVRVNRMARDVIGSDPTGGDLTHAFRDPRVLGGADAVIAERTPHQVSLTVQDPVPRFFSVHMEPLPRAAAGEASVLIVLYDLTERQRAEQMRADFVANASHELRTPLTSLLGFIETLQGPARDDADARERFLGLMHEQAARMARLVQDLLALSAIELDEHTPPTARVSLVQVLGSVIAALELEAKAKGMTLESDVERNLPPVQGAEDQLTQLFQNLIDNAIKYGRPDTPVRVSATFEADVPLSLPEAVRRHGPVGIVRIAVTDQGEGISAEHIPRLTERFYRVDEARSRAVGGTGLGLAIVKHIVSRHRGALEIESEVGKGSTFAVLLPVMAEPSAHAEAGAEGSSRPDSV